MAILDKSGYESISKVTLDRIKTDGFCVWTCENLGGEKITIIRDRTVFNEQLRFSDPRRAAADYPRYTVQELRTICADDIEMIRRATLIKKNFPDIEVVTDAN